MQNNKLQNLLEVLKDQATEDFLENESIIEAIKQAETEPEKTYYLLGEDATNEYHENGIKGVLKEIKKNDLGYGCFCFFEGITHSTEFAEALNGWYDYAIITEEEYNQL